MSLPTWFLELTTGMGVQRKIESRFLMKSIRNDDLPIWQAMTIIFAKVAF
jgi:hypothetical protein